MTNKPKPKPKRTSRGRPKGRPKGSRNRQPDEVAVEPSRCNKCQSTEREPYFHKHVQEYAGFDPRHGGLYTHIIRRWTRCRACGQVRIDRFYENRIEKLPKEDSPF